MSSGTPDRDPGADPEAVLQRGLERERHRNTYVLSLLRFVAISAFFALQAVLGMTQSRLEDTEFDAMPPVDVKGKSEQVRTYAPI